MQTISKTLLFYQMRLRHMIKIILFSWILYRFFFSLNFLKVFQFDFKIASIKASLQNVLMQMEANNPMQQSKKKKPKLEHSFNVKKGHVLHISRFKAVSPSSFTNTLTYWQLLALSDMLEFTEIFRFSVFCGIRILRGNLCNSYTILRSYLH